MSEVRLIDADALKKHKVYSEERHEYVVPVYNIDNAPTVESDYEWGYSEGVHDTERPQGEWIKETSGYYSYFRCNNCNSYCSSVKTNFCPNCGARMKGGAE